MRRSGATAIASLNYRDVRQVNTATSSDNEFDQPRGTSTPPVLAKVPWLRPRAADAEPSATQTLADSAQPALDQTPLDESLFRPHSVVAAADLGVEPWDTPATVKPTGESVGREFRIDPPQPLIVAETPEATAQPAEAPSAKTSPEQTPPARKSIYRETPTVKHTVEQPAAEKPVGTTLRFDPPETATDNPLPTASEPQPAPSQAAPPQTLGTPAPQPAYAGETAAAISAERLRVTVPRSLEPSTWHTWVSKIDDSIRQYHRVIVLAALLTAAGLMMLVLENQHQPTQPAPESVTPAAAKTSADDGNAAVENSAQPLAKVTTEAKAAEENAASLVQSEANVPALSDTAPAGEVVASPTEGPLAGEAEPTVPFSEFVSKEQTNEPGQLATAKGPRAAKPHPAVTTTRPLEPHRELHAASPATPEASPAATTAFHSTYQSTGAPEIVLPGYSAGGVRTSVPRTARLSGEVHSVPQQATR